MYCKAAWKCPCGFEKDGEHFMRTPMLKEDFTEISNRHFKMGWHGLGEMLSFVVVNRCTFCDNKRKSRVYANAKEPGVYKCDICLHMGCNIKPGQLGYEKSMGNLVRSARSAIQEQSSAPSQKRSLPPPASEPKAKQPYTIDWNSQHRK